MELNPSWLSGNIDPGLETWLLNLASSEEARHAELAQVHQAEAVKWRTIVNRIEDARSQRQMASIQEETRASDSTSTTLPMSSPSSMQKPGQIRSGGVAFSRPSALQSPTLHHTIPVQTAAATVHAIHEDDDPGPPPPGPRKSVFTRTSTQANTSPTHSHEVSSSNVIASAASTQTASSRRGSIPAFPVNGVLIQSHVQFVKALYRYDGIPDKNVIGLAENEVLQLLSAEGDWWLCQRTNNGIIDEHGQQGFAPRNYLSQPYSPPPPLQQQQQQQQPTQQPAQEQPPRMGGTSATSSTGPPPGRVVSSPLVSTHGRMQQPSPSATPQIQSISQPPPAGMARQRQLSVATRTGLPSNNASSTAASPPPFIEIRRQTIVSPTAARADQSAALLSHTQSRPTSIETHQTYGTTVALFDYTSDDASYLSFKRGTSFTLLGPPTSEWWHARDETTGKTGYIPSNYVQKPT